jgi:hypothetical protein
VVEPLEGRRDCQIDTYRPFVAILEWEGRFSLFRLKRPYYSHMRGQGLRFKGSLIHLAANSQEQLRHS